MGYQHLLCHITLFTFEAILLAAMQEFSDRGFNDARFVLKVLASDPAKFGSFLRKMIPRVDDNLEPQIQMVKLAAVYLIKSLSGKSSAEIVRIRCL